MKKVSIIFIMILILVMAVACVSKKKDSESTLRYSEGYSPTIYTYYLKNKGLYQQNVSTNEEVLLTNYKNPHIITDKLVLFIREDGIYIIDSNDKQQKICDDEVVDFVIYNRLLYYCNSSGVYSIKIDGLEKTQLSSNNSCSVAVTSDYIFFSELGEPDDWIYYDDGISESIGKLIRVNIDGTGRTDLGFWVTNLNSYDNLIYFSDISDNVFYEMNPNSLMKSVFYASETFMEDAYFYNGHVFFLDFRSLAKISIASREYTVLREGGWNKIEAIINGYIYFTDSTLIDTEVGYLGFAKIRIDGSGFEQIYD